MKRDQGKGSTARSNAAVRICFLHNLVGQLRTRNMPRSSFNFSRPLCGLFLGETMSKGKWAFRPTDLKRAIKASSNTGLEIARAEIEPATGPKSGLPRTGAILTVTANNFLRKAHSSARLFHTRMLMWSLSRATGRHRRSVPGHPMPLRSAAPHSTSPCVRSAKTSQP
jgi:hypothetical protein